MRIGLIADIHGNAFALREVLGALDRVGVDAIYCLGDIATPGPWPVEVMSMLAEREIPSVLGNTDQWLLAGAGEVVSDSPAMDEIAHWATGMLAPMVIEEVASLPMHRMLDIGWGVRAALFHGSPTSTEQVFSELTPGADIAWALASLGATVGIGGHTHVQMVRDLGSGLMVNPGSVGLGGTGPGTWDLPIPEPVATADFAVLRNAGKGVDCELYHLDLDVPRMLREAAATEMPYLDWWSSLWRP